MWGLCGLCGRCRLCFSAPGSWLWCVPGAGGVSPLPESLSVGTVFGRLVDGSFRGYADRREFVLDPETGVQGELEFWDGVRSGWGKSQGKRSACDA